MDAQSNWSLSHVIQYWDAVAHTYLQMFRHEFDDKPFDQDVLHDFASRLPAGATVLDVGCGPCGHVTSILADQGLRATGIDISPHCIALAKREHPQLAFETMDMAQLGFEDARIDGLVAYYALHYHPRSELPAVLQSFGRVLRDGGQLLLVAKYGDGEGWIPDPMNVTKTVFWSALTEAEWLTLLLNNGFTVESSDIREPLKQEIDARRLYIRATRAPR